MVARQEILTQTLQTYAPPPPPPLGASFEHNTLNEKGSLILPQKTPPPQLNFAPFGNTQTNFYWELRNLAVVGHLTPRQPVSKFQALKLVFSQLWPLLLCALLPHSCPPPSLAPTQHLLLPYPPKLAAT